MHHQTKVNFPGITAVAGTGEGGARARKQVLVAEEDRQGRGTNQGERAATLQYHERPAAGDER